jgi:hypothetical protein
MAGALAPALDRIRPHPHRGDVIAAGAVVLALAILVINVRMDAPWGTGVHLVLTALTAALVLGMAFLSPMEGPEPRAYQSVLLVTGLLLLEVALGRLGDVLGADGFLSSAGAITWTQLALAGAAAHAARERNSAVCLLIAAAAFGIAVLAFVDWVFSPDGITTFRYILILLALGFTAAALVQRASRQEHSVQLINAAGLSVIALELTWAIEALVSEDVSLDVQAGWGWEFFMLAAGCGLVAYSAVDRVRGPGYIGFAALLLYVSIAAPPGRDGASLIGWPIVLLVIGGAGLAIGLRPRRPLPPEPGPPTTAPVTPLEPTDSDRP